MTKVKKIILLLAAAAFIAWLALNSNGAIPAGKLRTAKVAKADMCEYIKLRGKMELERKAALYARIPGVLNFTVREGDAVNAGARVAVIGPEDLNITLKRAEAFYQAALAGLEEVRNSVKIEQIKQAEQQLGQAKIALAATLTEYNYRNDLYRKMIELRKSGSVSEQNQKDTRNQYDTAESARREAEARVKIAEYNLELLKKGSSEHLIKAAESGADQAKASIEEVKNNIAKSDIISAFDGVILTKFFEPGSFVQPGALLFEIGDTSSAHIRCDVLTDDIAKIQIGRGAVISGDILGAGSAEAEVIYIAPKAFTKVSSLGVEQQKIEVRLSYDKNRYSFRPGYEFDVDIIAKKKAMANFVPYKAVFDMNGRSSVFVIKNDAVELRSVDTGIENDDFIEITSGASENETVIVDPPNAVKPGLKVKR